MRPVLMVLALLAAAPAGAGTPLALSERQVVTLEFARPVARLATTDPDLLALEPAATRLRVTAQRAGRAQLELVFDDGATATFDVVVAPVLRAAGPPAAPGELVLAVGQSRRLPAPGLARLMLEENGVLRVQAEAAAVVLTGASPGRSTLVLVDEAGQRTTVPVRVVP
jgi:putative type II/III system pilus formation protein